MRKKYEAIIEKQRFVIKLEEKELCSFVTHFGHFGDIEIYDTDKDELILNTIGIIINSFYPDERNKEVAYHKSRHLTHLFEDYNHQRCLKYPAGRLRSVYKELESRIDVQNQLKGMDIYSMNQL